MLQSIHRQGYRAPDIRRVYIPKPGKTEKRPLGVPTVSDRALQRATAEVLSAIYEQDFLACSFGGRPKLSAHHALATFNEIIAGGRFAQRHAGKRGRTRPETIYFLGLTLYCTRNLKGNFKVNLGCGAAFCPCRSSCGEYDIGGSGTRSAKSTPSYAATMPITVSPGIFGVS